MRTSLVGLYLLALVFPPAVALRWFTLRIPVETFPVVWSSVISTAISFALVPGMIAVIAAERAYVRRAPRAAVVRALVSASAAIYLYGPLLWRESLRRGGGGIGEVVPGFILSGATFLGAVLAGFVLSLFVVERRTAA